MIPMAREAECATCGAHIHNKFRFVPDYARKETCTPVRHTAIHTSPPACACAASCPQFCSTHTHRMAVGGGGCWHVLV